MEKDSDGDETVDGTGVAAQILVRLKPAHRRRLMASIKKADPVIAGVLEEKVDEVPRVLASQTSKLLTESSLEKSRKVIHQALPAPRETTVIAADGSYADDERAKRPPPRITRRA